MDYELIEHDKDDAYDVAPFLSYARARSSDRAERDADVGDVVHFKWAYGFSSCQAAIVLDVEERFPDAPVAHLKVMATNGDRVEYGITHDEAKADGSWHWPCGGQ